MATEKGQLTYYKWYFDKSRELEQMVNTGLLSLAQAAELFFSVQEYGEKGTKREMSTDSLKILFVSYCGDVDRAKGKYQDKVNKLAENGAKGGRAKAAKAAAAKEDPGAGSDPEEPKQPKFKPPTKAEFTTASRKMSERSKYDFDQYDTDRLYDELKENRWQTENKQRIFCREDWEAVIKVRLYCDYDEFYDLFLSLSPEPIGRFFSLFNNFSWKCNLKSLPKIEAIDKWSDFLKQRYGTTEEDDTD